MAIAMEMTSAETTMNEMIATTPTALATESASLPPGYISSKDNYQAAVDRLNVIRDKIQAMDSSRHKEVLRIIRTAGATYSENSNGVFMNISILNEATLLELEKFIQITDDQNRILTSVENEKEKLLHEHYEGMEAHS